MKDVIKKYLRANGLPQYVRRQPQGENREQEGQQQQRPLTTNDPQASNQGGTQNGLLQVDMIFGGPHEAEASRAARQRFANSLRHEGDEVMSIREGKRPRCEREDATFGRKDVEVMDYPHTDASVITATIGPAIVSKLLVDNGSSVNILFKSTFDKMRLSDTTRNFIFGGAQKTPPKVTVAFRKTPRKNTRLKIQGFLLRFFKRHRKSIFSSV